jgi:hypothetical protein
MYNVAGRPGAQLTTHRPCAPAGHACTDATFANPGGRVADATRNGMVCSGSRRRATLLENTTINQRVRGSPPMFSHAIYTLTSPGRFSLVGPTVRLLLCDRADFCPRVIASDSKSPRC